MYSAVKSLLDKLAQSDASQIQYTLKDTKLAAAVLFYRVIHADGRVLPQETARYKDILQDYLSVSEDEFELFEKTVHDESVSSASLSEFTNLFKNVPISEKQKIIDFMSDLSVSDNELHEFELNLVARVAELMGMDRDQF